MDSPEGDVLRPIGNEFRPPPISQVLTPEYLVPVLAYAVTFRLLSLAVKTFAWNSFEGFKQYRLHNLSICLFHSLITGSWVLAFTIAYPSVMFNDALHYWRDWAAQLPLLSIGYFIHDAIDMLQHELSRWTVELLIHHSATIILFSSAVLPHKFLPYAYWALFMECNSIFLHIRSLMQISAAATNHFGAFRLVKAGNVATFIVFRFAVQAWQIHWIFVNRHLMHVYYFYAGFFGGFLFLAINTVLFFRILVADGFLGERMKSRAAINRDEQRFVKTSVESEKKVE